MEVNGHKMDPILITGKGKLVYSITVCLLQAGHPVKLLSDNIEEADSEINTHFSNLSRISEEIYPSDILEITDGLAIGQNFKLAIAVVEEDLEKKKAVISQLEKVLPEEATIGINSESIPLSVLQQASTRPERIIGVNWAYPAHTTYFLELVGHPDSCKNSINLVSDLAKKYWNKDPYIVNNGLSIRAKMFAAMMREAFFLVENGYASVEDIDRACRNDAGYYLPFAGNFRYMDLMGTYSYGMVMKDLNPELSKEGDLPQFFKKIVSEGNLGMENNQGFYKYETGDPEKWENLFNKFSYQIQGIISKYPFAAKEGDSDQIKSEIHD